MIKRVVHLKVIAIAATLLLVATSYFAVRKVMVCGVELGMSRAEVLAILGEPTEKVGFFHPSSHGDGWETILFSTGVFRLTVVVAYDDHGKVNLIMISKDVFGRQFHQMKQ